MSVLQVYGNNYWVGYDDASTLSLKMCFARDQKLGGVFSWDAELDDDQKLITAMKAQYDKPDCGSYSAPAC